MIRSGLSETEPGSRMIAFREALNESGYVEGQNVTIESRWAEGPQDRYSDLVDDLIRRKVSAIIRDPGSVSDNPERIMPIAGAAGCCARAARGHAAPPPREARWTP